MENQGNRGGGRFGRPYERVRLLFLDRLSSMARTRSVSIMTTSTPRHNYVRLELRDDPFEVIFAAEDGQRVDVRQVGQEYHVRTWTLSHEGTWGVTHVQPYPVAQVVRTELRS